MARNRPFASTLGILLGLGIAAAGLVTPAPARAQYPYQCPPGYYYYPYYGCVLPNYYALPPYYYPPPYYAYPEFGLNFRYGGGWAGYRGHGGGWTPHGEFRRGGVSHGATTHGGEGRGGRDRAGEHRTR